MKINVKNFLCLILSMVFALSSVTYAISPFENKTTLLRSAAQDPIMSNGVISWDTEGKAATSGIYYRTIGWNIHKQYIPSGNISQELKVEGNTKPYATVKMDQLGSIPIEGDRVKTFFEVTKDEVDKALYEVGLDWQTNEYIYLSAITEVRQGTYEDYKLLGTYQDLDALKNSQGWAKPDDFNQYFNRKVKLDLSPTPIQEVYKVNGEVVEDLTIDRGTKLPGEIHYTTFPQTIEIDGGVATLKESYVSDYRRLGLELNRQTAPHGERSDEVPSTKGIDIVGEYEKPLNIVVEHVNKDTGEVLLQSAESVQMGENITVKADSFSGVYYMYLEVSKDGGETWGQRTSEKEKTCTINEDTIIRLYYTINNSLKADLKLSADPMTIPAGKPRLVTFTLDATDSVAQYGIEGFEFWLSDDKDDLEGKADVVLEKLADGTGYKVTYANTSDIPSDFKQGGTVTRPVIRICREVTLEELEKIMRAYGSEPVAEQEQGEGEMLDVQLFGTDDPTYFIVEIRTERQELSQSVIDEISSTITADIKNQMDIAEPTVVVHLVNDKGEVTKIYE